MTAPISTPTNPDFPDVLYHYTTQVGLLGILESQCIWATQIQFMNDATEFREAIEAVKMALHSRFPDRRFDDTSPETARLDALFDQLFAVECKDVFVLSLTEEGDQLSQWRAYSGSHSGFAIGFDVATLCKVASEHGFSLDRCIYDPLAHQLLAETLVDNGFLWLSHSARMTRRRCREFGRALLNFTPLAKHYTFEEEREWRLVSTSHLATSAETGFRAGPSMIIPYYKLPLHARDGSSVLSSVTVGPTPHSPLSVKSVQALTSARGFSVPISESQIPLRTW
jgi:DUF2971 family protein